MTISLFLFFIFTYSGTGDLSNTNEGSSGDGGDSSSARGSESSNSSTSTNGGNARKRRKRNDGRYESRRRSARKSKRKKRHLGKKKRKQEKQKSEAMISKKKEDDELFKNVDEEVKGIISDMVADKTKVTYRNANITLLFWIYDGTYKTEILNEDYIKEMDEAEENGMDFKVVRKNQRNISRRWLENIENESNCPIVLSNLTFEIFSRYLAKRKESKSNGKKYLSKATYGCIQSALCHIYRMSDVQFPDDFYSDLSRMMSGLKKRVQRQKQKHGYRIEEGKSPMSIQIYSLLCNYFLKQPDDDSILSHTFLTLEWNLMARSDSVTNCHINHIEWRNDSLIIFFAHTKGDQEGINRLEPWHIYSNPVQPDICPILSLAKYLFSNPSILSSDDRLFPGGNQYSRFMKSFRRALLRQKDEIKKLGGDIQYLGSHSARKGAATLAACGCTVSPPMASICLRAGWSMGPVKERYLFYEKAGDQFVGRTVCGLSPLSVEFATGPPHFNLTREEERKVLNDTLEAFVGEQGKIQIQKQTWYCIIMLFASLLYHYDYLKTNLHPKSSLFACIILTDAPQVLKLKVRVSYPWDKDNISPVLTGIPPHILVLAQLDKLTRSQLTIADDVVNRMKEELDNRDIGGGYHASQLMNEMHSAHSKIIERINDVKELALTAASRGPVIKNEAMNGKLSSGSYHCYGGKFHRLPKGWTFPQMKLQPFIVMMFVGSRSTGVPPLRSLVASDVAHLGDRARKKLSEMKALARAIEKAAKITGVWKEESEWTLKAATDMFHGVFKFFRYEGAKSHTFERRHHALSWKTIYNNYLKNGKRLAGEMPLSTTDTTQQTLFECSTINIKL